MKKSNRILALLLVMVMAMSLLVACGGNDAESAADADQPAATETVAEDDSAAEEETEEPEDQTEATQATEAKKETTAKKTESTKKSTKESTKSTKESKKETTKAAKVCYITVEGVCTNKEVAVKDGTTVYDALKATGASISAKSTGYGIYIEGINGRFEFDEGPTSGWVYTVNGNRINDSCDGYKVKSGDKIVWSYVQ